MGLPCIFIRLTGCNLRCGYCDTEDAFFGGEKQTVAEVLDQVANMNTQLVEVTGGEPLLQKECRDLLQALCDRGYTVLLETSGSVLITDLPEKVAVIMDIKCPSSGESGSFMMSNLKHLKHGDEVKFVMADRMDYDWSLKAIQEYNIQVSVLFSPVHGVLDPKILAEWILDDQLEVRLQVQLHKYIWGEDVQGI